MSDSGVQDATFYYEGGGGANLASLTVQTAGSPPGYDLNGNLTSYNGKSYAYDAQNRLTSAASATFYYDGKNRQIARNINGTIRISVWDGWDLIEEWSVRGSRDIDGKAEWPNERERMSQYASASTRTAAYLQGAQGVIKSLLNNVYYYQDKLGSTTHVANTSGQLLESYKYDLLAPQAISTQPLNPSTPQPSASSISMLGSGGFLSSAFTICGTVLCHRSSAASFSQTQLASKATRVICIAIAIMIRRISPTRWD